MCGSKMRMGMCRLATVTASPTIHPVHLVQSPSITNQATSVILPQSALLYPQQTVLGLRVIMFLPVAVRPQLMPLDGLRSVRLPAIQSLGV